MGQAKQRGSQEQRISQAKAKTDALRPEKLVCGACKTAFTEFAAMDTRNMRGINAVFGGQCPACDESVMAFGGQPMTNNGEKPVRRRKEKKYMPHTSPYLPNPINLPGGVVARIELDPMPKPDAAGKYPLNSPNTDIQVSLFRNDELIERRCWDTLICGADAVTLADGSTLDADDLYELDDSGWEEMSNFGMIPTVWAG
jgi:hypothetical protein